MPANRKKCAFDSCDREASRGAHCQSHYNQKRLGKELAPLRPMGEGKARVCGFDGCNRPHLAQELCRGHYQQQKAGKPLVPLRPMAAHARRCDFEGCERPHAALGFCRGHYQQQRKGAELTPLYSWLVPPDAVCRALPGCLHRVYSSGMCRVHNDQRRLGIPFSILAPPVRPEDMCSGPECAHRVESDSGLCRSHALMRERGDCLVPLVLTTRSRELSTLLQRGVYWCTSCQQELPLDAFSIDRQRKLPRSRCKTCLGVELRAKNHMRTFLDIFRLFEFQGFKCALCPIRHEGDNGLHLDHDHKCCPKKGESCGKCIRGLLCWGCNAGVLPWYERIRGTGEPYAPLDSYLNEPPTFKLGLISAPPGS